MNWFLVTAAALMFGGAVQAFYTGNPKVGALYCCYGVANGILALLKG